MAVSAVVIDAPSGLPVEAGPLDSRIARGTSSTSRRGWLGVAGLLVCGVAVACGAANTPSLLPQSVRPLPASLAGPFGGLPLDYHVSGTIVLFVVMMAAYCLVVTRVREISPRVVIGTIVVLNLLMLLAPPLLSTDVFSYQAYARMGALYGINPYVHGPYAIRLDPVFPYIGSEWSYTPTVYGPLFTGLSYLLAPLSVAGGIVAFKSIALVASLGIVAIVWACARIRGVDPTRAVALVGLNPLLVVYGVGAGHNDLLMLLVLSGALYALLRGWDRRGGATLALAVALKLTAISVLPFALAAGGRTEGWTRRRRILAAGLAVGVAVTLLSIPLFGTQTIHLLGTLTQNQRHGDATSFPGAVGLLLHLPGVGHVLGDVLAGGFAVTSVALLVGVWRGAIDWVDAAGWATLAMLVAASSLLPWYVSWLLPLAAIAHGGRLRRATLVLSAVVQAVTLIGYLPHP